jgi:bifunctional ADP-heptose synthase (sugar kinase/adenylyltransferase)
MVAGLACVDWVVLFGEDDASALIRALRPDLVCKGGDWRGVPTPELEAIEALGGRFAWLRETPSARTTLMIERMRRALRD